jgi:hypothetical protein
MFQIGNELAPDKLCQRWQPVALSKNTTTHTYYASCKTSLKPEIKNHIAE